MTVVGFGAALLTARRGWWSIPKAVHFGVVGAATVSFLLFLLNHQMF
jgi:hypothetical protein